MSLSAKEKARELLKDITEKKVTSPSIDTFKGIT